jgi:adenine/guanine phosphoribosyltransferase-like PRPP-binding protein
MGYAGQHIYGSELSKILKGMKGIVKNSKVDAIAVAGFSGVVTGTIIARACGIPMICIRKEGEKPAAYQQVMKVTFFRKDLSFEGKYKIRYLIIDDTIASGGTARRIMENISLYSDKQATCSGILLYDYYTCRRKLEYQNIHVPVIGAEHYDGHTCGITIS